MTDSPDTPTDPNCCCQWGAAVAGEYPEFPCADCKRHDDDFNDGIWLCLRHRRNRLVGECSQW